MLSKTILTILLAFPGSPQDEAPRAPDPDILSVQFADGPLARVRVLGFDQDRVKLRMIVLDGSMEVLHRLDEFEPGSAFRIELAARNPQSYEEHFALAKRAASLDLWRETGQQVASALRQLEGQQDAEEKILAVRSWSADSLQRWLEEAVQGKDLIASTRFLMLLSTRYPDLRSEEELDLLALAVETLERDRAVKRRAEREARLDEKTVKSIQRRLKPILAELERGDELYRKSIRMSSQMTQSAKLATSAIEAYRKAWRSSIDLRERHPGDDWLVVEIEDLANHLHDHSILAALHSASLLAVRGDYLGAMEWVRWVLAIDPGHKEALEMRRTIKIAGAASSGLWGIGWGADLGGTTPR